MGSFVPNLFNARGVVKLDLNVFKKLNLGCGVSFYRDYLNINFWESIAEGILKDPNGVTGTYLLNWDLRKGIPVGSETIEIVYHSHFLEHLNYPDGIKMIREISRVLKPGGVHRIVLPDLRRWIHAYLNDDLLISEYRKRGVKDKSLDYPTPCSVLMAMVHGHEHKCIWDFETLKFFLSDCGFVSIEQVAYQTSSINEILEIEPYEPLRTLESLCVECVKG